MAVDQADSIWGGPIKEGGLGMRLADLARRVWSIEQQRLGIWSPLLFALGIWTYFAQRQEPPMILAVLLAVPALWVVLRLRHRKALLVLATIALGFSLSVLRTAWVSTPLLRAFTPDATLEGYVTSVETRGRSRHIMVIDVVFLSLVPPEEVPRSIRLEVTSKEKAPDVGNRIRVVADVAPLPRPVAPGAFDFGRQLFFESIGATARTRNTLEILPDEIPLKYRLDRAFHDLRQAIAERIRTHIKGPLAAFAIALITGERASISRDMNESLLSSGLFHILSISGLHMSLVAGGAFWAARAGLALSPRWAVHYPIKKWASVVALLVGFFYMLLADSGPATERSFIMIAVVFFAILVDRPALSLHNLAIAALLILALSPEQALAASFQMSFMAVMGLAAFFEWWKRRTVDQTGYVTAHWGWRWCRKLFLLALASVATSLIAGVLSGLPAAHHFGRVAPYSIIANALALPIVGFLVMPMAMASVLLMPLGLEALPLTTMEQGLKLVMMISDWVASWPHAGLKLPLLPASATVMACIGFAFLCLAASMLRWLALPAFALAGVMLLTNNRPVLLVDDRAATVAIRTAEGLAAKATREYSFALSKWLEGDGDPVTQRVAKDRPGWSCNAARCEAKVEALEIIYLTDENATSFACEGKDVVIASFPLRQRCKGRRATIDRFDVWREGAFALYPNGTLQSTGADRGIRPWVYVPRPRSSNREQAEDTDAH